MKRVDCADIRDAFQAGAIPAGPEVEEHVEHCARCAELFGEEARVGCALADDATATAPSEELWIGFERTLRAEKGARAWLRSRPTYQRTALALTVAALAVGVAAAKPRADWASYPKLSASLWFGLFSVGALGSLWLMLAPLGRPRAPVAIRTGSAIAALGLPASYALGLLEPVAHAAQSEHGRDLVRHAAGCFLYGSLLALPFLGLAWALERSDRLSASALLFAGAASGLVANLALLLRCPINDQHHLLLGHATIGIMLAFGLGIASRLLARSR